MKNSAVLVLTLLPSVLAAQFDAKSTASPEPVVLTGVQLPTLLGKRPSRIVAFAYRVKWERIPVQVDERALLPYGQVLKRRVRDDLKGLLYTDPNTFTGADPDPKFDADDELVVLAGDAGLSAPGACN